MRDGRIAPLMAHALRECAPNARRVSHRSTPTIAIGIQVTPALTARLRRYGWLAIFARPARAPSMF